MNKREYEDRSRDAERRATWDRLRSEQWHPDRNGRAWDSGRPRVQVLRFPSLRPASFLEFCERRDEWVAYRADVIGQWPSAMVKGYEPISFDSAAFAHHMGRLSAIAVPAVPPVTGTAGLDGTVTRLTLFGDLWAQVRYQWWDDHPPGWTPLVRCVDEMLALVGPESAD